MMDAANTCLCCLLGPPDKDLSTPYPRLGTTEIYSDMLDYCFQIQLTADGEKGGICEDCVGQLRDARDFKLQVECSQARLQAWGGTWRPPEDCLFLPETDVNESSKSPPSHEERPVTIEIHSEDERDVEMSHVELAGTETEGPGGAARGELPTDEEHLNKADVGSEDEAGGEMSSEAAGAAGARQQLAMSCCVRVERLRSREPPSAPHEAPAPPHGAFVCFLCKKSFSEIGDLVLHTATHTGQKPYSCQVCYKMFTIKSHLMLHTKIHSENREQTVIDDQYYECDMCKKKYKHKHSLLYHINGTHTGRNLFACDVCGKTYPLKIGLTIHKRVHTGERPYKCDECNKAFRSRPVLRYHKRIHTGVKPNTCDICQAQFLRKTHLIVHIRLHTGQKPYTCKVCNKKFACSSSLTRHKKIHTKKE